MRLTVLISAICLLISCKKEDKAEQIPFMQIQPDAMMLVCAEGNFRWNNAEAGLINLISGEVDWKAFSAKNNRPLGDVLQSAAFWNGRLLLVVNNSGRLESLDPATFEWKESYTGFNSPRYLQAVSETKAYVSDLYASALWVVKPGSNSPAGKIIMPGWTEEMLLSGNRVWVVCRQQPWLIGIDSETDLPADTIFLPGNATSLAAGRDGSIWAGFEKQGSSLPGIGLFHPDSVQALQIWNTPAELQAPDRLAASESGDTLFFLNNGAARITSGDAFVFRYNLPSGNWYGLGLDTRRKRLILSDVKDYQQDSRIIVLDFEGQMQKEWSGGIISSRFYFW